MDNQESAPSGKDIIIVLAILIDVKSELLINKSKKA